METYDYSSSVIYRKTTTGTEKCIEVLQQEIEKRTGIALYTTESTSCSPVIHLTLDSRLEKEDYSITITQDQALLAGGSPRGLLYAVGKLLRSMLWKKGVLLFPALSLQETPEAKLRGHQLGYRPKTNAYDAWSPQQYDQYIRELALFGANSIELIPPGTDDAESSVHMKWDPLDMLCHNATSIHSYGLEVWLWCPIMEKEYSKQIVENIRDTVWERVFSRIPYLEHIFIPGGDPGSQWPKELFLWAKEMLATAKRYHPKVQIWLSPQSFTPSTQWMEEFYAEMEKKPDWLAGIVFAPWIRDDLKTIYRRVGKIYPIRFYPDISHNFRCQFPIPKWDLPLALTLGRESINPRPKEFKNIFQHHKKYVVGSITYSEGINDDVNKFVWSLQSWNPKSTVLDALKEYARFFIDPEQEQELALGFLQLEDNLRGPLAQNTGVSTGLTQWQAMEKKLSGFGENNFRFEMGLLRAYFDAYQQERWLYESHLEKEALAVLRSFDKIGIQKSIQQALALFERATSNPVQPVWQARVEELADRLFQHIGAQLTVSRHGAESFDRGGFVEALNIPLNDRRYYAKQFQKIIALPSKEQGSALIALLNRTDPGPGGFYTNFGSWDSWKHLEGHEGYTSDPGFYQVPLSSFLMQTPHPEEDKNKVPLAWQWNVSSLYQNPLRITYSGLDPKSRYEISLTYARYHTIHQVLYGGEKADVLIHDEVLVDKPFVTVNTILPPKAYREGKLSLVFRVRDGERGPNVSEIIIRKLG